ALPIYGVALGSDEVRIRGMAVDDRVALFTQMLDVLAQALIVRDLHGHSFGITSLDGVTLERPRITVVHSEQDRARVPRSEPQGRGWHGTHGHAAGLGVPSQSPARYLRSRRAAVGRGLARCRRRRRGTVPPPPGAAPAGAGPAGAGPGAGQWAEWRGPVRYRVTPAGAGRVAGQWAEWRAPVRYSGTPAARQSSMTSSSRVVPPGWTIARTPASMRIGAPSAKGKRASEAATAPRARSGALSRSACS